MTQLVHTHIAGCFEVRASPLDNPANTTDVVWEDDGGSESRPVRVTNDSAQTFAPWWQGLNVISNDVAGLPLKVYERLKPRGKEVAWEHPTYKVLHRRPNPEMSPFTFKHLMQMRCLSTGNAYAYIERRGGEVAALWPLDPERVTPFRVNGELFYDWVGEDGRQETLEASEVFHLRGPGDDGLQGKSVFKLAKESLIVGMQAQRYGGQFFKNDASPGLVLEFPGAVDETAAKNILKHWERRHGGAHNARRPAFLDRGGKVSPFSISNVDAQFLESRNFSKSEVASWFNLPPHKVGDLSRATFSNIEQQSIDYVVYSLMPWLIRWQEECNAKLFRLSEIESESHFCEFVVNALLRGDFMSRMQGYQIGLTCGIYNQDEVRDFENLNSIPGGLGQTFYYSQNMTPLGTEKEPAAPEPPEDDEPTTGDDAARQMLAALLINEISRAYQRIGKNATRAASSPGRLQEWINRRLKPECDKVREAIAPACEGGVRAGILGDDKSHFGESIEADFHRALSHVLEDEGGEASLLDRVAQLTKRMAAERPAELISELWSE